MGRTGELRRVTKNQKSRKAEVSLKTINPKRLIFGVE